MEPDERVVEAVERIVVGAVAITARALGADADDLTLPQWRVLVVVGEAESGVSVGRVGLAVGVSAPSASRLLRRLEDRGLIELARDDIDRRFMRVRLTRTGHRVREDLMKARRMLIRNALRAVGPSLPADIPGALEVIADALAAGDRGLW